MRWGRLYKVGNKDTKTVNFMEKNDKQVFSNEQISSFSKISQFFQLKFRFPETQKFSFSGKCIFLIIFDHFTGFVATGYNKLKSQARDVYVRPTL